MPFAAKTVRFVFLVDFSLVWNNCPRFTHEHIMILSFTHIILPFVGHYFDHIVILNKSNPWHFTSRFTELYNPGRTHFPVCKSHKSSLRKLGSRYDTWVLSEFAVIQCIRCGWLVNYVYGHFRLMLFAQTVHGRCALVWQRIMAHASSVHMIWNLVHV